VLKNFGLQCRALFHSNFAALEGVGAAGGPGSAVCAPGGKLLPGASFIQVATSFARTFSHQAAE
jgi:glycerate kinase